MHNISGYPGVESVKNEFILKRLTLRILDQASKFPNNKKINLVEKAYATTQ